MWDAVVVVLVFNSNTKAEKQEDLSEFRASLAYIASSRTARAPNQRETLSKEKKGGIKKE